MHTENQYKEAKKRVKNKKEFYQHLSAYLIVNTFLFILNMIVSHDVWWSLGPLLGWGIGLSFHYIEVFGFPGTQVLSKDWEERELEKELRRFQSESPSSSNMLDAPSQNPDELNIDERLQLRKIKQPETLKNYDDSEFV